MDASKEPYRIYIVEDSPILQRLLLEMLGGIAGASVVGHADTADLAIAEIRDRAPHAVIMDIMLESGTGFDVLKAIMPQGVAGPRTIVLSNFTGPRYRQHAALLGAAHFFDKSTEILQMFHLISRWVEEHRRLA